MNEALKVREVFLEEYKVDTYEWMRLYLDGRHDELAVKMLEILWALSKSENCFVEIGVDGQYFIDSLCQNIGFFFTKKDFVVNNESLRHELVSYNVLIQNLFKLSCFGCTDSFLKILGGLQDNLWRFLALYNSACNIEIPYAPILAHGDTRLISVWYGSFMALNSPMTVKMQDKMNQHLSNPYLSMHVNFKTLAGYFYCSYVNNELDRNYKSIFNSFIKNNSIVKVKNIPNKKRNKIGVLTSNWISESATYKSLFPYFKALCASFDLTLIHLSKTNRNKIDRSIFKNVFFIEFDEINSNLNIESIINNDFCAAIYPDVGAGGREGLLLSNIRIAPSQIAMYGFPVSTFGSEIDFFIGGEDVEKIDLAANNYSEKLVTIKGIGAIPVASSFIPNTTGGNFQNKRIAFLGNYHKLNSSIIEAFGEIAAPLNIYNFSFLFLLAGSEKQQSYMPASKLLRSKLGENIEVSCFLPYDQYMQKLHSATICLDAYPFGGFNTIVDALHLGKPVVTWEGTKAYNRLASAVLRRLGLCELIATSKEEYVSIATRLLTDKAFYDDICARIASLDIDALLYTREDELEDFVSKIKMIIDGEIKRV